MARWDPPPPRFPHNPAQDSAGPGWYLPNRPYDERPRDYEGPHGAGLFLPMVDEKEVRTHRRRLLGGVALILLGIGCFAVPVGLTLADELGDAPFQTWGLYSLFALGAFTFGVPAAKSGVVGLRLGRSGLPKVMLTVDGVVQSRHGTTVSVPWDALGPAQFGWTRETESATSALVHDPAVHRYRNLRNWVWFDLDGAATERHLGHGDGPDELQISVDELDCDPRLAVLLMEFYRDHPEERAELNSVLWEDRVEPLARTLGPLVVGVKPDARARLGVTSSSWEPPPAQHPHDPQHNDFGPGWYLRSDHAAAAPREHHGTWGDGFAVAMVPGYRNRPHFGVLGILSTGWACISGMLLTIATLVTIEDGWAETPISIWIAAATFPLAVAGVVVEVRRFRQARRKHSNGEPAVVVTEGEILLLDSADQPQSRIPWEALGSARLYWDKREIGPSDLRLDAMPSQSHKGDNSVGPYRRQRYRLLLNWVSWELDPEVVHHHRGELLGAVPDELVLVVDRFHCDPRIVVRLIEYYRDHPAQRSELTSGAWQDRADQLAQPLRS